MGIVKERNISLLNRSFTKFFYNFISSLYDWELRKVLEIAKHTYGGGTPKTNIREFWNGNIPWIQSSDLETESLFNISPKKKITLEAVQKSATKIIPSNSIAVVTRVGVGKLALISFEYATSQDFLSLSGLYVDSYFGIYSLYFMLKKEQNNIQGTSIKGMTKSDLLGKKIVIPKKIEEQKKIGIFFKRIDDTIALHQRKLDLLKQLKQTYLQKMFPWKGEKVPELRFSDFDNFWEQCNLGKDVSLENGYAYKSAYFQDEQSKYILLTPGNVLAGGGFQRDKGRYYSPNGPMPEKFIFDPNDIFITMTDLTPTAQTLGYPAIVPNDGNVYLHNQRLGKLNSDTLNLDFLKTLLTTDSYHKEIVAGASGTTVKHTSPSKILDFKYLKPSCEEQKHIGRFFNNIEDTLALYRNNLNQIKRLKTFFLKKMFI